jgi:hypothetical protein
MVPGIGAARINCFLWVTTETGGAEIVASGNTIVTTPAILKSVPDGVKDTLLFNTQIMHVDDFKVDTTLKHEVRVYDIEAPISVYSWSEGACRLSFYDEDTITEIENAIADYGKSDLSEVAPHELYKISENFLSSDEYFPGKCPDIIPGKAFHCMSPDSDEEATNYRFKRADLAQPRY